MLATIRQRLAAKLVAYQQIRALRQLQAVSGGLLDELTRYAAESRSTGCQWTDYWTLYAAIRKYQPREVLECGTGVSTLVIAHALLENGAGRVTSMEESAEWFAMASGLLPDRYKSVVDLRLSDTVADGHAMFRGIRYKDVPARTYDFIFVDGPDFAGDLKQTVSCDFDFIHVLRNSDTPIRGIVDSRTGTFWTFARILGKEKVRFSYLQRHGIILPCTCSDIRDAPKIVEDDMREHAFRRPRRAEYTF
jgi:methyltransferase family protein